MTQTGGEKELILGNKQLISLFFIVVALCGVFFAMGYMVRGNSLKGSVATTDGSSASSGGDTLKRQQPEPPRETIEATTPPIQTADTPPLDAPSVQTHPADDAGASAPLTAETKSEPKPDDLEPGGTYVQVTALPRANAESTVRTLREQHFPATLTPSSKEGLFRVQVGPYHSTADVADAKARLKALGFSDTQVRKQ